MFRYGEIHFCRITPKMHTSEAHIFQKLGLLLGLFDFICMFDWSQTKSLKFSSSFFFSFFFLYGFFFHNHSWIRGLQGKREGISLTPHYHFHPLHRHLDISQVITAESSPLHIGSSWTQTGNLWFLSASS